MTNTRSHPRSAALLLVLTTALSAACASGGRPLVERQAGQGDGIVLEVENQNFSDANVFAVWGGGARDRLGLVTGHTTQVFNVPWKGVEMRVEVDFIGGGDTLTEAIGVSRGDNLRVVIPPAM